MSKGQVYAYQVDLTKREEIYRAADRLKQEVGKVCKEIEIKICPLVILILTQILSNRYQSWSITPVWLRVKRYLNAPMNLSSALLTSTFWRTSG
jgi:hypothetical protein